MAAFSYSAINAEGLQLEGEIRATDLEAARDQLRSRGLLPRNLKELTGTRDRGVAAAFKNVKPRSLQIFSRQFATLIQAGVSMVAALVIIEEQTEDKNLAAVVYEVRADVESGVILSVAFARHPKVFSRLYVAMVEAGEASGTLDLVLDRVAVQIEKETKIKRRVKGAMIYPLLVLVFASLVLTGMLLFLVPIFVDIFKQLNGQLPTLTQMVVNASNLFRHYWFVIFPLVGLSIWGFFRWKKSERGRPVWDRFKLRVPMRIGDTVRKITMARFG